MIRKESRKKVGFVFLVILLFLLESVSTIFASSLKTLEDNIREVTILQKTQDTKKTEIDKVIFEELETLKEGELEEIEAAILLEEVKAEDSKGNLDLIDIQSEGAVLMEGSTGQIIYAKNETKQLRPASITKIMTLLLIFEALESGQISLTDSVTVSEHAASMGGSQVFLEPFETQDVNTLIKCISIASANDACVAYN